MIATTHSEMLIEAKKSGIKTTVIHSSSILSAAPGIAGLQAYKFGKVTTIPFTEKNFFPHSPYMAIKGQHGIRTSYTCSYWISGHMKIDI